MQHFESQIAEDSCLKYHNQNEDNVINDLSASPDHDVEKTPVEHGVDYSTERSVVDTQTNITPTGNGILDDGRASTESRTSSIAAPYVDEDKDDFPEGGFRAWSVVLGAFCGCFAVFGLINCTGIFLDYFSENQLQGHSESELGWIFGLALFLTFFCGAPVGPIFDAYGPRILVFCGSILSVASVLLMGLCTKYWHFLLCYSLLNGIGGALIFTPCIASIGHFFLVKRGNATGIAMTAGSIGGVIFPLMLQKLFPTLGFAWGTRIVGFMILFLLIITNLTVRSRLPLQPMASFKSVAPDLTAFKDIPFSLLTFGIFMMEWGIFVPLTYITSYATSHGQKSSFGFQVLAILNAGSFFGRFFAGLVSDMIGRVNTLILTIGMCVVACFALWLPAGESTAMIVVFAVIFGFASGSNLSLSPVCIGQMCKTEHYGRYFATCWMAVAFGTLTGLPIAGQILTVSDGDYTGLIVFAGLSYAVAMICLIAARVLKVGWKFNVIY